MIENILNYIHINHQQSLNQLFEVLRIPSISTDPTKSVEVHRCAKTLAKQLRETGMEQVEILPTSGHPIVYAEWLQASSAPTILIYGHYDVQPVDPIEQWESPPSNQRFATVPFMPVAHPMTKGRYSHTLRLLKPI